MPREEKGQSQHAAPDPASSYGREKPEKEAGMGRLDNNKATPANRPDQMNDAVKNKQPPRQINAQDEPKEQPDHSMHEEEPLDVDLAPQDIKDPKMKRHPRKEGRGGTP
jgi:hypothetical protein